MGFTTGFTGGVTLTLSIAYLTVLAHQRNRQAQAAILRQQTYLLSEILDPLPPALPPTRAELAAAKRANLIDTAKNRWNADVEGAVRCAQTRDWDEVREGVETAIGRLWASAFGRALDEAEKGEQNGASVAQEVKAETNRKLDQGKAIASEKTAGVTAAAKSAYADAKARGAEAVNKTEEKAEEAKGSVWGAIGKGVEKAKSAVGLSEQEVEFQPDANLSPVERALYQRYHPSSNMDQSVEDLLAARYAPVNQKDDTQLKAT
ncbi:hypothetical protein F4779DRAFT_568927 [Xylariaceae sp. FL0662B]|nr:hypothetical protein F4779DRAFT_568927 [Xylariaceae sp. FL0662B]